jgi:hypothetical protein
MLRTGVGRRAGSSPVASRMFLGGSRPAAAYVGLQSAGFPDMSGFTLGNWAPYNLQVSGVGHPQVS